MKYCLSAVALLLLSTSLAIAAQDAGPEPLPFGPKPLPLADTPYPGTISLAVDATDTVRGIFRVHESIPVSSGPLTLFLPKWLPGNHSPSGQIDHIDGIVAHAGGAVVPWKRDPVDVYAFHIDVPAGAKTLDLDFQYLSPVASNEGRVVMTQEMLNLQWDSVALYPAGYYSRDIPFAASVKLPAGWQFGTALETASTAKDVTTFKTVPFNTLVDSPMFAGKYFKRLDLDPGAAVPVHMDIVADAPDLLAITPDQLAAHRALVQQAYKLYGSHHYDHYDFLLSLSDRMSGIGLEHHRSSEDGTLPKYFTDWSKTVSARDLLSHEYTHSWNGKFRRPADLWTPNFNVPMRDSLLWVYEGQTQYWGFNLAARAGLWTKQDGLDAIAANAATFDNRAGKEWRPLEDTTNDPIMAQRRPEPWRSWQRSEDYYGEGALIWLDADTLIRERSHGARSLDDFAKLFFGIDNGSYVTSTFTFDDVVAALSKIEPYDWASFLHARLDAVEPHAPLDGITRGGYRLVYTDKESEYVKSNQARRKMTDPLYSIGLILDKDAVASEVLWDSPAFAAGMTVGAKLIAVDGVEYSADSLKEKITQAKTGKEPIVLLIKRGDQFRTLSVEYHGGLRYPHLERDASKPALLDAILAAK